jgi:hypothetical protein
MIHALELPDITLKRLLDVVLLQMHLLFHAAEEQVIDEKSVELYLRKKALFKSRSKEIAHWFWERGTTTRHEHLENFAKTYRSGTSKQEQDAEQQAKKDWCHRLLEEVAMLFSKDKDLVCIKPYMEEEDIYTSYYSSHSKDGKLPHWKAHAKEFLLYFYETCLEGDKGFPACFFSEAGAKNFGRQDLLAAFIEKNEKQEICAICNESQYYLQGEKIHAHLDHYLPKSKYPHFACHPYNLVPVCYFCNSPIKSEHDPFIDKDEVRRTSLHKETFPYHHFGLSQATYLQVKPGVKADLVEILDICPRPKLDGSLDSAAIKEAITLQQELYHIPERWRKPGAMLKISDTLFRRMRHFIGDGQAIITGSDMNVEVYNALKQLLYYLDQEDQQKDPFAFAMTWILVALLEEENPRALVEEVNSWTGQSLKESHKRHEHAEKLLKIVRESQKT